MGRVNFWDGEMGKEREEKFRILYEQEGKSYEEIKEILNYTGTVRGLKRKRERMKFVRINPVQNSSVVDNLDVDKNISKERKGLKNSLLYERTDLLNAIAEGTYESRPFTDEEMFAIFNIDSKMWTVTKRIVNTWARFFQTKLWLSRNEGVFEYKVIQEEFNKWLKKKSPKVDWNNYKFSDDSNNKLLEINISDPHFDKLAWGKESGDNYDIQIAREVFIDAVRNIIYRAKKVGFCKILFIVGNDLFNSEGKRGTTTEGTPQDTDVRWKRSFSYVVSTLREAIEICSNEAPVEVIFVLGNHDEERTYYAGEAIRALFTNNENIEVDNTPRSRKYYAWGKNMIQFLHGYLNKKKMKTDKLPMIIAQEEKQMWANTEYRYSHLGHWHHNDTTVINTLKDEIGVTVQVIPSIAGTDGWHYDSGYIGTNHQAKGFIYDKENGLEYEITYNAPRYFYLD